VLGNPLYLDVAWSMVSCHRGVVAIARAIEGNRVQGGAMRLAADILLLIGAAFALLGALGILRMPDVYNRIQAGTKAVTLGALAFLIGVVCWSPAGGQAGLHRGFVLFTSPVSSSTIARALYISGSDPGVRPRRRVLPSRGVGPC